MNNNRSSTLINSKANEDAFIVKKLRESAVILESKSK